MKAPALLFTLLNVASGYILEPGNCPLCPGSQCFAPGHPGASKQNPDGVKVMFFLAIRSLISSICWTKPSNLTPFSQSIYVYSKRLNLWDYLMQLELIRLSNLHGVVKLQAFVCQEDFQPKYLKLICLYMLLPQINIFGGHFSFRRITASLASSSTSMILTRSSLLVHSTPHFHSTSRIQTHAEIISEFA